MTTWLKIGTFLAVILGFGVMVLVHQSETKRLQHEIVSLRSQLEAASQLQEENRRLSEQVRTAREALLTERGELLRSRAQNQALRQLEQENAQLKTKWDRLTNEPPVAAASDTAAATSPPPIPDAGNVIQLGAVELTHGVPNRFDLGNGQQLLITPLLLDNGSLQMDLALVARNPAGQDNVLASPRVTAQEGQRVSISVGNRMISFEATLKLDLEEEAP